MSLQPDIMQSPLLQVHDPGLSTLLGYFGLVALCYLKSGHRPIGSECCWWRRGPKQSRVMVLPADASCEDLEVDPALPFLNGFVQQATNAGTTSL